MGPIETSWTLGEVADEVLARVKPELAPGERLLWAEASLAKPPAPWSKVRISFLWALGSLAACWGSFVLFSPRGPREGFVCVGIVAAMIGMVAGLVCSSSLFQRMKGRGSNPGRTYALTDRRAIIWMPREANGGVKIHSYTVGSVGFLSRNEYPDGSGDIQFYTRFYGLNARGPQLSSIEGITDVRRVEELVRRTLVIIGGDS